MQNKNDKKLKFMAKYYNEKTTYLNNLVSAREKLESQATTQIQKQLIGSLLPVLKEAEAAAQKEKTTAEKNQIVMVGYVHNESSKIENLKDWQQALKKTKHSISARNAAENEQLLAAIDHCSEVLAKAEFFIQLRELRTKLEETMSKNPSLSSKEKTETLKQADKMIEQLDKAAFDRYYKEPAKSRLTPEAFNKKCQEIVKKTLSHLQKKPDLWEQLNPIFKGFLGVLAAITLIPALVVEFCTKKGYVQTFFPSKQTAAQKGPAPKATGSNMDFYLEDAAPKSKK